MKLNRLLPRLWGLILLSTLLCPITQTSATPVEQPQPRYLIEILEEISERYQVFFSYELKYLEALKVDFHFRKDESLQSAIDRLLDITGLKYKDIGNNYYVIYKDTKKGNKKARKLERKLGQIQRIENKGDIQFRIERKNEANQLKTISEAVVALKKVKTITGKVTDQTGEPLIGVNILIKGTGTGTVTDLNGTYSLDVPDDQNILLFSYTGYASQEIEIDNQSTINITLLEDAEQLEEVVVVGYGAVKKSDLTGSVTSVSSEQLKSTPIVSLDQGLQGRAPGVQVTQQSHQPGGGVSIRVRGGNSLTAGTEPLYVVDGFPIYSDNRTFSAGNSTTGSTPNALSSLNPNDIESIEILKDASATAIYGSRGANGVVIITTKRGKSGRPKVEFDAYYGRQTIANKLDLLNAEEYITILNEGRSNDGFRPVVLREPFVGVDTDWQDEVYNASSISNYQLSVSGGGERTRYAVSGNLFEQEGIIENSAFQRGSLRLNLDTKITDKIEVGTSTTYSLIHNDNVISDGPGGGAGGITTNTLLMPPVSPVSVDGELFMGPNVDNPILGVRLDNLMNPLLLTRGIDNQLSTNRFLTNIFGSISLTEGLQLRISGGMDGFDSKREFFSANLRPNVAGTLNSASIYNTKVTTWLNENTLTYDFDLGEDHQFNLLGGFTQQTQIAEYANQFASDVEETTTVDAIQSGTQFIRVSSAKTRWDLLSWLGRVNYNLMGKYLFTGTVRWDGSSKFGQNNKWGFFPSMAFAWRLIEEDFISDLDLFSDLKLRTSYGITGNQEIGTNRSQPILFFTQASQGDILVPGVASAGPAFEDLRWERTAQFDIGIDVGLVDNRFRLTADYYTKTTTDLLFNLPVPTTTGNRSVLQNVGEIVNRGIELGLSTNNLVGAFKWETNIVMAYNENELTQIADAVAENGFTLGNGDGHIQYGRPFLFEEGQPIGNFFGYVTDGIWQQDEVAMLDPVAAADLGAEAGEIKYVDTNSDGFINDQDRQIIGNAIPTTTLGITNTFSYKGFDLSIFFNGMFGQEVLNYQNFEGLGVQGRYGENNHFASILDRWTPENPSNTTPKATSASRPVRLSDLIVEEASFLRLQNVSLGYTFNTSGIRFISSARIYVSGQNLAIWTNYTGYDPEVNSGGQNTSFDIGIDRGSYPASRTFLFGTNITF